MEDSLKQRFLNTIIHRLNSDDCRIYDSYMSPPEEKAEKRFKFKIKEILKSCGALNVDICLVQEDGYSTIHCYASEDKSQFRFDIPQRRQSTWKEYDETANTKIDEVVCIAETIKEQNEVHSSMKWEEIITGDKTIKFSGKVRAWNKKYYISPICDKESRLHLSKRDKMLLPVRSLYGSPVCEGMIHSRIWELSDNRLQGYDEWQLSALLEEEGITLVGVRISKDTFSPFWYDNLTDTELENLSRTYLLAEAVAYKEEDYGEGIDHKYAVFSFRARYSGTEEQWKQLEDTTASDLIVRFSFKPYERGDEELSYYEPLWVAAIYGERTIFLSGDRIDYKAIQDEAQSISSSRNGHYSSSWEMSPLDHYLEMCDLFGDDPDDSIIDSFVRY